MVKIYVDADACPVKQEIYRVAGRHRLKVILVANTRMRVPDNASVGLVLVDDQLDAADNWIAEHVKEDDIVITGDIPLASRCLKKGAIALSPRGKAFTEDSIGAALASRELLSHLREVGTIMGGPAPFKKRDRSQFLHCLDESIQTVLRSRSLTE